MSLANSSHLSQGVQDELVRRGCKPDPEVKENKDLWTLDDLTPTPIPIDKSILCQAKLALRARAVFCHTLGALQDWAEDEIHADTLRDKLKEITACKVYSGKKTTDIRDLCNALSKWMKTAHWDLYAKNRMDTLKKRFAIDAAGQEAQREKRNQDLKDHMDHMNAEFNKSVAAVRARGEDTLADSMQVRHNSMMQLFQSSSSSDPDGPRVKRRKETESTTADNDTRLEMYTGDDQDRFEWGGIWKASKYHRPDWACIVHCGNPHHPSRPDHTYSYPEAGWQHFGPQNQWSTPSVPYPADWVPPVYHKHCGLSVRLIAVNVIEKDSPRPPSDQDLIDQFAPNGWNNPECKRLMAERQKEHFAREWAFNLRVTECKRHLPTVRSLVKDTFGLWNMFIKDMDSAMELYPPEIALLWEPVKKELQDAQQVAWDAIAEYDVEQEERQHYQPLMGVVFTAQSMEAAQAAPDTTI